MLDVFPMYQPLPLTSWSKIKPPPPVSDKTTMPPALLVSRTNAQIVQFVGSDTELP
jgi:hypothetical protein